MTRSLTEGTKKWKHPTGQMLGLLEAAHARAMKYEPTSQFPGVDIDRIHFRRGLVSQRLIRKIRRDPMHQINRIALSIRALEPA